ncbi:MAG: NFACT family protein, partial [Treponema sp.]|nr:NFACT family protein [Treponema sp.]
MSLNCNEINVILSELDITGAFVQDIVQPSFDSIAFYTYKPASPKTVFISLAASACRLHEVRRKIPKNEKPLRFMEMLRSRIKGARITSCEQIGLERIVRLTLHKDAPIQVMPAAQEQLAKKRKTEENEDITDYTLYIRLWSGAANIFLCDTNNVILDSFYRRPAKNEMTGNIFVQPEPKPSDKVWEVRDFTDIQADFSER